MATLTVVSGDADNLRNTTCFLVTGTAATTNAVAARDVQQTATVTTITKLAPKRLRPDPASSASSGGATNSNSPSELLRCKRRIHFGQLMYSLPPIQPAAVARRNERERNRVRLVNLGFATLRQHVPHGARNKKMSKVETLRSAVEYIKQLQDLLSEHGAAATDDENCYPAVNPGSFGSGLSLPSVASSSATITGSPACSGSTSPSPSIASDESSPYDPLSPEDEDLLDFSTWFS